MSTCAHCGIVRVHIALFFQCLKNLHKQKSEKLLQKLVETPFSFLHYKIALKFKLQ
jgi:hypothetical protein